MKVEKDLNELKKLGDNLIEETKLFINGIKGLEKEAIKEHFSDLSDTVEFVFLNRRYGFIKVWDKRDLEKALKKNGTMISNNKITVEVSVTKSPTCFVKPIASNVSDTKIIQYFSKVGEVLNIKRSKDFCYVFFKSHDSVQKALELKGKTFEGNVLHVDDCKISNYESSQFKVLVTNVDPKTMKKTLFNYLTKFCDVQNVRREVDDNGKLTGYLVHLKDKQSRDSLLKKKGLELSGKVLELKKVD